MVVGVVLAMEWLETRDGGAGKKYRPGVRDKTVTDVQRGGRKGAQDNRTKEITPGQSHTFCQESQESRNTRIATGGEARTDAMAS